MQSTDMNWIASGKMFEQLTKEDLQAQKEVDMRAMYDQVEERLKVKTTNLPEGMRTPTSQEIENMEVFRKEYKTKNPKASTREIRRAIQRKFNVQILPNT